MGILARFKRGSPAESVNEADLSAWRVARVVCALANMNFEIRVTVGAPAQRFLECLRPVNRAILWARVVSNGGVFGSSPSGGLEWRGFAPISPLNNSISQGIRIGNNHEGSIPAPQNIDNKRIMS